MSRLIPAATIAVVSEIVSERETHASLDNLFMYAGAFGDPPDGSKPVKASAWLRATNKSVPDPLRVLGRIVEGYLEQPIVNERLEREFLKQREKLLRTLADSDLQYSRGGLVSTSLATPTRALSDFIRERDMASIEQEFQRAVRNADSSPREAVSAASNILESVCKVIIADEDLPSPNKQDLQSVWGVVRKHLGIDPSKVEDQDLQQILTGLFSVVHGIGSLRTHASSAHGAGRPKYKLEPRHARLAIHSAHTLALYVLESWTARQTISTSPSGSASKQVA